MAIKYAINGFGRIGRNILRAAIDDKSIDLVAINDLGDPAALAHLLKYDSVHGKFPYEVTHDADNLTIVEKDNQIKLLKERDPAKLPWSKLGVDVVLECTGVFRTHEAASLHLKGGANRVIISAPSPDADVTIVYGVNEKDFKADAHKIVSNGSCTTNCLAPVAKVLLENFGIQHGMMTTVHSYTNDQRILDLPHKDLRRARSAALSMIPTSTGAAKALSLVIPELKGKVHGMAVRVPTPDVSLVDLVCNLEREVSETEVNQAIINAANGPLKGVLAAIEEPLVSSDFIGRPESSLVDLLSTLVVDKTLVKVISWYDNEMGFSNRMLDVLKLVATTK